MTQNSLNKYKKLLFLTTSIFLNCLVFSQKKESQNVNVFENLVIENKNPFLEKSHPDGTKNNLPYFLEKIILKDNNIPSFILKNIITRELTNKEIDIIANYKKHITSEFSISKSTGISRNEKIAFAKIVPIRLNNNNKY